MKMTRRDFGKLCAAGIVVAAVPIAAFPTIKGELGRWEGVKFVERSGVDPKREHGNALTYYAPDFKNSGLHHLRRVLRLDAKAILPEGWPYEIRIMVPTDYGRTGGMAWYYEPGSQGVHKTVNPAKPSFTPETGYSFFGRYIS